MRFRGGSALVCIVGSVVSAALLGSCARTVTDCSEVGWDATFVGRVTAIQPAAAEFTVETVTAEPGSQTAHTPVAGKSIAVHYDGGQERYLRVGEEYEVSEAWLGGRFVSGVHVGGDACSGGTVHADGSSIDTTSATARRMHRIEVGLLAAPVVALVVLGACVRWRRRRRTESVRVDDRYL